MTTRPIARAALLALSPLLLAGCGEDSATPMEGTVRLAVVAGGEHGGKPFTGHLSQEVTSQPVHAGDPDGTGTALLSVNAGQGEICWETAVSSITLPATASHIHRAPADIRGPIVVFLSPPDATGTAAGCRTGLDRALLEDILTSPEEFYVNVHTSDFPAGAIRDQLER